MTGAWRRFATDLPALAALAVVVTFVGAAMSADLLAPYDPLAVDLPSNYLPASRAHLLGTDHLGRDTFSRLLAGARVSLTIAMVSTSAGLLLGAVLGLAAAWARGRIEGVIMQAVDVLLSFPDMLLAIAVATILGRGPLATIVAVAVFSVPIFARLVRASAQGVVRADFVLASRAAGASSRRVLLRHVLPQCYAPLVAQGTITLGSAILFASGLSFLGLGVQPPDPEWGAMLARGRELLRSSPIGAVAPG
ncbi:MAG: ABC transporter permease, partial [Acidobacteriota bacterium]|nr:ABC transporter permease [Acidobacteriota bacterium]